MLLLDTHAWIWLVRGDDRLSEDCRQAVFAAAGAGLLFVSVMSIWELGLLVAKRRLTLSRPSLDWVRAALERSATTTLPVTPEIAIGANELPGEFHADPIDRLLTATARIEGLTLVTSDRQILAYADQGYLRALGC